MVQLLLTLGSFLADARACTSSGTPDVLDFSAVQAGNPWMCVAPLTFSILPSFYSNAHAV